MVDFRPLLFLNALALMLLVTAGFASVRDGQPVTEAPTPSTEAVAEAPIPAIEGVAEAAAEPEVSSAPPEVHTEPFRIAKLPEETLVVASAEPPAALATYTADAVEPAPKTGALTLRSNVAGDQVEINGKTYGATRLDLELAPGKYDITISKAGFRPWQQSVALDAGSELTLVGKLEAYTTVNYQNGAWTGGVKTGDGTYEDSDGLRYDGHFVNGAFHGQGTLTLDNGDILTGEWSQGQLNGHGSLTTADGMLYVGGFRNNDFHGHGTLTYPDGRNYEGDFSNGTFHGKGSEVFANGKKYEGEYIEGKFHGNGLLRNPNGSSIEATFRHGEPYGQVRLTTAAGEVFTARTTEPGVCYRDKSYRATQCPTLEGW
ncbi:Uncharacterized conserved protein [Marinobacter antarcticus]|uniref:Uncharacterized conserved protein n=1 Tax=Marinobacter antarcticus TaxID=564117 RepID=A0A1M6S887_9GAMM|nr:PEGA domain-containing protein [Marinobacter antarcticus]SHK40933.1 Uncharacterized conserved protein [Marinobacter antarcticus]